MIFLRRKFILAILLVLIAGGGVAYYKYSRPAVEPVSYKTPEEANVYVRFTMEAYDSIVKNYWSKMKDEDMATFFQLSLQKAQNASSTPELLTKDRAGTAKMISDVISALPDDETRKKLVLDTLVVATYNLQPVTRNGILSSKEETALRQNVSNINPDTDLYKNLGLEKGASPETIEQVYKEKAAVLAKENTPEAKAELEKISYAKEVLTNANSKALYDEKKIEPTVSSRILGTTLYLAIGKISPTTLQEFGLAVYNASTTPKLDSMIIDFRGNIGGALDFLQYFLGLFIGEKQYAFDLFHQDDYQVQRTTLAKFEELNRYKEFAILTDSMTQSTAELTTATFKRFRLAHVVGATTRGWGTVENTYPIETIIAPDEKYSLLLVNNITLRDDNQPIEGRGVDPDIDIKNPKWRTELTKFFRNPSLIEAISKTAGSATLK
jgi:curved DNA-binding protein CbpA